jgi:hypothetical protein
MRTKIAQTSVALFPRWLIFSSVAAAATFITASQSWATTITISTSANAVDGWRTIAPVGNLEGQPISAVGLEWEADNVGWNSSLTFDDSSAAGWHVPVPRDVSVLGGTSTNNIWSDGDDLSSGNTPVYFRKTFVLNLQPTFASFGTSIPNDFSNLADDDVQIYINGQPVYDDQDGVATQIPVTDVTRFLHPGPNLIAAKAHDSFGLEEHFSLVLSITGNETDNDGDGVPNDKDECPDSDVRTTVTIDGCNAGVTNTLFPNGCTISDLVESCSNGAGHHGQFVNCVSHLTNDLKNAGTISGQQKGAIKRCGARAQIP